MHDQHFKTKIFIAIGIIIVLGAFMLLLETLGRAPTSVTEQTIPSDTYIPPYTDEVAAQLAASNGFQQLVSFTDNGFEPVSVQIKKGETIRFTNNSSGPMWVAARGVEPARIYPGSGECGQSAFDMCKSIGRGEFWEFTFDAKGEWGFQNFEKPEEFGSIRVQ